MLDNIELEYEAGVPVFWLEVDPAWSEDEIKHCLRQKYFGIYPLPPPRWLGEVTCIVRLLLLPEEAGHAR